MKNQIFDEDWATQCLEILSKKQSREQMFSEITQFVEAHIAQNGREMNGMPTLAAVLEETINLSGVSVKDKLSRILDIIEFMKFMNDVGEGIPSPMPETVRKVMDLTLGFDELLAPHRRHLN